MDLVSITHHIHLSQSLSPTTSPTPSILGSHLHSSNTSSFPILVVAIIGILATALLLVSYYVFVIKCCLNWHRVDAFVNRFSFSRNRGDPVGLYSPRIQQRRGLDESVIQSIPIMEYKGELGSNECSVCLNEFIQGEKLRVTPNCSHLFHVDCIDVWLQSNVNCPLCRTSISTPPSSDFGGQDENYVVIELGNAGLLGVEESVNPEERPITTRSISISPSPRKLPVAKKAKKLNRVSSMGDECIDTRNRDDQFVVQPRRRSISMDSAEDKQLYLAVQGILQQQNRNVYVSSSQRFSFRQGKGSRSAVLPVGSEP